LKEYNFSIEEINNLTMEQLNHYYAAIIKKSISSYQTNVSATLLGSRGSAEQVKQVFERGN